MCNERNGVGCFLASAALWGRAGASLEAPYHNAYHNEEREQPYNYAQQIGPEQCRQGWQCIRQYSVNAL